MTKVEVDREKLSWAEIPGYIWETDIAGFTVRIVCRSDMYLAFRGVIQLGDYEQSPTKFQFETFEDAQEVCLKNIEHLINQQFIAILEE